MFQVKCADCGCIPDECMKSPSEKDCPNCTLEECCCWFEFTLYSRTKGDGLIKRCTRCGKEFEYYCKPCNEELEN